MLRFTAVSQASNFDSSCDCEQPCSSSRYDCSAYDNALTVNAYILFLNNLVLPVNDYILGMNDYILAVNRSILVVNDMF